MFIAGEFEDAVAGNSLYREGDFNLDGDFTTADLTFALQRGSYDSGANVQAAAALAMLPAASDSVFEDYDQADLAAATDDADEESWT